MKKTSLISGVLCWLILSVPATMLFASPDDVGKVVAARGEVSAVAPDGAFRRLTVQSPVHLQDTIRTGPRGRVQIMFSDNTLISLGRESEMRVAEYEWDPAQKIGAMKTEVKEGAFRVLGGAITKSAPEKFTTETPVATIGIRGSMYAGSIRNGLLAVVFQGGTGIYVTNSSGTVDIRNPGFGTRVRGHGKAPEPPGRFESEEMDEVLGELEASAEDDGAAQESETAQTTDEDRPTEDQDQTTDGGGNSVDDPTGQEESAEGEPTGEIAIEGQIETLEDPDSSWTIDGGDLFEEPLVDADPLISEEPFLGPTATDPVVTETLRDSTQADLSQQLEQNAGPPPPVLSGKYMAALYDFGYSTTESSDATWSGDISGVSVDGLLSGQAAALDGKVFPLEIAVPLYNGEGAYTGPVLLNEQDRTVNLMGSDYIFPMTFGLSSNLGDFVLFSGTFFDGTQYYFEELGFMGTPSAALPTDGMAKYDGLISGTSVSTYFTGAEPISASLKMGVNWYGGKAMGIISDSGYSTGGESGSPVFFFGDLSGTSLINVRILGSDADPYAAYGPTLITGNGTFGQFYGSGAQGFGLTGQGETYEIFDQSTPIDRWQVTGGAFLDVETGGTSARGKSQWEGFVVGVGEDMLQPDIDRRFFVNAAPGDFSLTVNRDLGTVDGSISAADLNDSGRTLDGISVGGGGSTYIDDDTLIALITDGGSGIRNGANSGGLKTYGNYLVTEDPANRWGDYLSWGYWEAAYVDPQTGQHIHVHMPASLWVAGQRTPATEVQGLIDSNFTGHYLGNAKGVHIDMYGSMQDMTDGRADLLIKFGPGVVDPVTGSLTFVEQTINVGAGGSVDSGGFKAGIVGGSGGINGAFYGPGAAAVGGNFAAEIAGEKYLGIFGGHLSAPQ